MTAAEYRDAIHALGLSHAGAGRMLGISPRQAQRLASGESGVPAPVDKLLRLMIRLKINPDQLTWSALAPSGEAREEA